MILLTISMGWEISPPIFCTTTETVADLANAALRCNTPTLLHRLDVMVEVIVREAPPKLHPELAGQQGTHTLGGTTQIRPPTLTFLLTIF